MNHREILQGLKKPDYEYMFDTAFECRPFFMKEMTDQEIARHWFMKGKDSAIQALSAQNGWKPYSEYHEDDGFVQWHCKPVCEPAYIGNLNCDDWPYLESDEPNLIWCIPIAPPTEG